MAVHDGVKERGTEKKKEACVAGVQEWGGGREERHEDENVSRSPQQIP